MVAPTPISDPAHSSFCEHGRLKVNCEDCAFLAATERGRAPREELHAPKPSGPEPVLAEHDTLIPDSEHPGRSTLVKAGDPLPPTAKPARAKRSSKGT